MRESSRYLDPEILSKVSGLELRARQVVEGYLSGRHRSPYGGASVEFFDHRPYSPGHELKHIDWKLWARTDRFYVKLYEEETNVRAYFLVDASGSMAYGSGGTSKYDHAAVLAASLAHLLLMQQDAAGLTLFDTRVRDELAPAASIAQIRPFCRLLEQSAPGNETDLGRMLHSIADRLRHRGLVILLSDLGGDPDDIVSAIPRFRYEGHSLILLHVLDRAELEFPFEGNLMFEGLEGEEPLRTDARHIQAAYLEAVERFIETIRAACLDSKVDYLLARTDRPPEATLTELLLSAQRPA